MKSLSLFLLVQILAVGVLGCQSGGKKSTNDKAGDTGTYSLLTETRQLTYGGRRSGEGYFSPNGQLMVFQSERQKDNPFYQIYLMDMNSGETKRVSPGHGKTTCSWIHPTQRKILYSSTHRDPQAKKKQKDELEFRAAGKQKRYSWDYDENYDIFESSPEGKVLRRLTRAKGYDAEGSYSPDGRWIAFASNRHAYLPTASEKMKKRMKMDPSFGLDIYIMRSNGTQLKRLTKTDGYDGGPFFSPDGKRITWRRFAEDGHTAEVYTMNVDGTDQKKITSLNSMSWAPFYHPSGDYLIFTTNLHGYSNFELYIVDVEGTKKPVRVTDLEGFDGLPVFTPDGKRLTWSRKAKNGESQIYIGNWNDELARKILDLPPAPLEYRQLSPEIKISDTKKWVKYLASADMKGRATGSPEEKAYQKTMVEIFKKMGLKPGGPKGSWYHSFDFVKAVEAPAESNNFAAGEEKLTLGADYSPMASSATGDFKTEDLIFAGYGLVTPGEGEISPYDSYQNTEGVGLQGQWFVILRDIPSDVDAKTRANFFRYARADHKVMLAEKRGARGVIFVTGPSTKLKNELFELKYDRASGKNSIPVVSVTRDALQKMLSTDSNVNLKELQAQLDNGEPGKIQRWQSKPLRLSVNLKKEMATGTNVIAELKVNNRKRHVMIGAHGDHLGVGKSTSSLMDAKSETDIHFGADDNASGMAGVMEVAHYLADRYKNKKVNLRQNVKFAIWSGEELGNLGSSSYVKTIGRPGTRQISAYVNMDMIGRMGDHLSVQGVSSSTEWDKFLEQMTFVKAMAIKPHSNPYLPTDAMSFYIAEVPIINFFTGAHTDYHTPRDTWEKVNYQGVMDVSDYVGKLTEKLAVRSKGLSWQKVDQEKGGMGRGFRLFLGTIPDYTQDGVSGVKIQGVVKGGPAEKAGLRSGDVIVQFSEHKVQSLYDYVYTLQVVKPGEATIIKVVRDGQTVELPITPKLK